MSTPELRKKIKNYIEQADERFLKMVYALSEEYEKEQVVGYDADGSPISKQKLKERAKQASSRVKSGDYISQEEINEELKNL